MGGKIEWLYMVPSHLEASPKLNENYWHQGKLITKKEHGVINGRGQAKFLQNAADSGEEVQTDYIGYFWTNNFSKNTVESFLRC